MLKFSLTINNLTFSVAKGLTVSDMQVVFFDNVPPNLDNYQTAEVINYIFSEYDDEEFLELTSPFGVEPKNSENELVEDNKED
jgi:hypothetical protein